MKNFCLLFVLLLALIMSGCGKSQDTTVLDVTVENESVTDEQEIQINSGITEDKAAVLLSDYLKTIGISKDNDPNLVITMDHTDEAEGQEYYVFQVFDDMNDHTATIGWYGVQKEEGSLYDFVLMKVITTSDSSTKTTSKENNKITQNASTQNVEEKKDTKTVDSDVKHNLWTTKASMNEPRMNPICEVLSGKMYAMGGINKDDQYLSTVEEYDFKTNQWTKKASMNDSKSAFISSVLNGRIYTFGGENKKGSLVTVEEYNPKTNQWTKKASMEKSREALAAVVSNQKIYVLEQSGDDKSLLSVEEYDPQTDKWTNKSSRKSDIEGIGYYATIEVLNGKFYVLGGLNNDSKSLATVEEYNPKTDQWTKKASMKEPRYESSAVVLDEKIYVLGGYGKEGVLKTVEEYDPKTNQWTKKASMKEARTDHTAIVVNGKLYVMGGVNEDENADVVSLSSVEEYNPKTYDWTKKASMNQLSDGTYSAILFHDTVYIIGGGIDSEMPCPVASVEEYTP